MPGEALLVELDDDLGTLDVGNTGGNEVRLLRPLPLHEEHELPARVSRPNDPLRLETPVKTTLRLCRSLRLLLRNNEDTKKTKDQQDSRQF